MRLCLKKAVNMWSGVSAVFPEVEGVADGVADGVEGLRSRVCRGGVDRSGRNAHCMTWHACGDLEQRTQHQIACVHDQLILVRSLKHILQPLRHYSVVPLVTNMLIILDIIRLHRVLHCCWHSCCGRVWEFCARVCVGSLQECMQVVVYCSYMCV